MIRLSQNLCALMVLGSVWILHGCGSDAAPMSKPESAPAMAQATVALPGITLAADDSVCAAGLRVEIYVKGQAVKGAMVEDALGCDQDHGEPRFYEFRRSFYRCGTLTHFASLPDGSSLRLVDRSASQCMDSHHRPQLEVVEKNPDGEIVHVTGRLTP